MSKSIKRNNQFYNSDHFVLVKVKFSEADGKRYTYAAHVKHDLKKGDWVMVPTGDREDVFNSRGGYRYLSAGQVTAVTDDKSKIPNQFAIKHVVAKIKGSIYTKLYRAKQKAIVG